MGWDNYALLQNVPTPTVEYVNGSGIVSSSIACPNTVQASIAWTKMDDHTVGNGSCSICSSSISNNSDMYVIREGSAYATLISCPNHSLYDKQNFHATCLENRVSGLRRTTSWRVITQCWGIINTTNECTEACHGPFGSLCGISHQTSHFYCTEHLTNCGSERGYHD